MYYSSFGHKVEEEEGVYERRRGWVTIFRHVKKGGSVKIMHCNMGGSWLNYSHLPIVPTANVIEISFSINLKRSHRKLFKIYNKAL